VTATERYGRGRLLAVPVLVFLALGGLWLSLRSPLDDREQRVLNPAFVSRALGAHLYVAFVALALALVLGLGLGVLLSRRAGFLRTATFTVANLSQAIPTVSILAFAFFILGIGTRPAIAALTAFSVLPILRNTVVGLGGVDPAAMEAATGMGMSRLQALFRVELPLASPVIFAGVRTAVVLNVSTATLATFIGGGGLGDILAIGIDSRLTRVTLVGATLVACLAMTTDWAAGLVEARLASRT
jgi:osmoprotectant transport system permease protein